MDWFGWLQLLPLIFAIAVIGFQWKYRDAEEDASQKVTRQLTFLMMVFSLASGVAGQVKTRESQARQAAAFQEQARFQEQQIGFSKQQSLQAEETNAKHKRELETQERLIDQQENLINQSEELRSQQVQGIQAISRLSLDRHLSAVEISYVPTAAQAAKIDGMYRALRPGSEESESSYHGAPIFAERIGERWSIHFGWTRVIENGQDKGWKMFPRLYADEHENKQFADIIREATVPLLIIWGDGMRTEVEPWTANYPTAVTVSRDSISLILRPPTLALYLGTLKTSPTVSLRTRRDAPTELRFRSLDSSVKFDDVLKLGWRREQNTDPDSRLKGYASGPHRLRVRF